MTELTVNPSDDPVMGGQAPREAITRVTTPPQAPAPPGVVSPPPGQATAPVAPALGSTPIPHATRVPPPPSSRQGAAPLAAVPQTSPSPPPSVRPVPPLRPRTHRPRRSVAAIAGWVEAADIPEDAAGRVSITAGEPVPASPPPPIAPGGGHRPATSAGTAGTPSPLRSGLAALSGWPAVAVLGVVLIVLFIVGMRLTR